MKYTKSLFMYIFCLLALCVQSYLHAATWIVDNISNIAHNYHTNINAAYNAASSGDTILLVSGQTFTGALNSNITINKNITFNSTDTTGTNPIIDMQSISGRHFCSINSGKTVTMSNLDIRNGNVGSGGAIYNGGALTAFRCIFIGNSATSSGGAIATNLGTLNVKGCTFSGNSATYGGVIYSIECRLSVAGCTFSGNSANNSGGAIYKYNSIATIPVFINCSRFVGNEATTGGGDAIFNSGGTVNAKNNWWGTNRPDLAEVGLFYGAVDYSPWLVINLLPDPLDINITIPTFINADFTQNSLDEPCVCTEDFDDPIKISTSSEYVEPTSSLIIDGQATTTLSDATSTSTSTISEYTDADLTTTYEYCETATPVSVYVSSLHGSDVNPGTYEQPVYTIQKGIDIALSYACKSVVLLEAGSTFTGKGNIDLTINKTVEFKRYNDGQDPIIDMEGYGRFCAIESGVTVYMSNLIIINGSLTDYELIVVDGGAIFNCGALTAFRCTFRGNRANHGGAIYNNNGTFNATGCTLSGNSAADGGALYNIIGTATINCSRFVDNTATNSGDAIYNDTSSAGTVNAENNWWGTNTPSLSLFAGELVTYAPWLVINLLPYPLNSCSVFPTVITADFTKNSSGDPCLGTEYFDSLIKFSTSSGYVEPTSKWIIDGKAAAKLSGVTSTVPFTVCAYIDADQATMYEYCEIVMPEGVYVSSLHGSDSNPGTYDQPAYTIQKGIDIALSYTCKPIVFLQSGSTFTGTGNINLTINTTLEFNRYNDGANPIIDMQSIFGNRFCCISHGTTVTMSNLDIRNGSLTGYDLPEGLGGAIFNYGILTAFRCKFSGNSVEADGGAIYNAGGALNATGCAFSGNSADYGGAIVNYGTMTAFSCTSSCNSENKTGGVIINNQGALNVTGCTFSGNSADNAGGALYNIIGKATINYSRFVDNEATNSGDEIYNDPSSAGTVNAENNWWGTNRLDLDACDLFSGAVSYTPWIVFNLVPDPFWPRPVGPSPIAVDFTQNSSGEIHYGTILEGMPVIFSSDMTISPTISYVVDGRAETILYDIPNTDTFSVCLCTDSDLITKPYTFCVTATPTNLTAVYVSPDGDDKNLGNTESNPVKTIRIGIERLSFLTTGTVYLQADNIFTGTGNKDLNITVTVNFARYDEGADPIIDMEGSGRFCTIELGKNVTISNLDIRNGKIGNGGAIYNCGTLTAFSCTFRGNSVDANGGAIYTEYASVNKGSIDSDKHTVYAYNCIFIGNSASLNGGAILNKNEVVYLADCTFMQNDAPNGGAIANLGYAKNTQLIGRSCIFIENGADFGGVLYNTGEYAHATINGSRFVANEATDDGDAIYNDLDSAGTVTAEGNWWGTNTDPAKIPNLLFGNIDSDPWITMAFTAIPGPEKGSFTITATFSTDCIPNGTPVIFSATEGTITQTASSTSSSSASTELMDVVGTATVCALVGPGEEAFKLCVQVKGRGVKDYKFLKNSTIDISTASDAIYALDWCQEKPGSLQPPLLAAGGAANGTKSCVKPNIFIYFLDNICLTNEDGPINPCVFSIMNGTFDSSVVNSVKWCCNTNPTCPQAPYLAVGGKTSSVRPIVNTRIYYINQSDRALHSSAYSDNSLASVNAVTWNPLCNCTHLTVGGYQQNEALPASNIIEYNKTQGQDLLADVDHALFGTNVTSLDWSKTNTISGNQCAYLAVGTTGKIECEGCVDATDQIVVYKAMFCKGVNTTAPCKR